MKAPTLLLLAFSAIFIATPTALSDNGVLVYQTDIDGDWNVYKSHLGDPATVPLTTSVADDTHPRVSFDETLIAFSSTRSSARADLWLMDIDGANKFHLTSSGSDKDFRPRWSSDDSMIAFSAYRPYGTGAQVMLINVDGSDERSLYYRAGYDSSAAGFTDDNNKVILFSQVRYGGGGAVMMSVGIDGSPPTVIADIDALVGDVGAVEYATVSADGHTVVFAYDNYATTSIYTIGADGTGIQMLAPVGHAPNWTYDGRIIYSVDPGTGKHDIWVMNTNGSAKEPLLADPAISFSGGNLICDGGAGELCFCCEDQNVVGEQDCTHDIWGIEYHTDGEEMCGPVSGAEVIHYWAKNGYPDLLDDPSLECSDPAIWQHLVCRLCSDIPTCWMSSLLSSPFLTGSTPGSLGTAMLWYFEDRGVTADIRTEGAEWSTIQSEIDEGRPLIYYDCDSTMTNPPGTAHFAPICNYREDEDRREIEICEQGGTKGFYPWQPESCDRLIVVVPGVPASGCGMGIELLFLVPPLMWLYRWRRRSLT